MVDSVHDASTPAPAEPSDPTEAVARQVEAVMPDADVSFDDAGHLVIEGRFSNPAKAAAEAMAFLGDASTVAVRAYTTDGRSSVVIRHKDTLTVVSLANGMRTFRSYQLDGLVTAVGIAGGGDMERRVRLGSPPWNRPSGAALTALAAVGLSQEETITY